MRLVLLTNMPSPHQADLAAELAHELGDANFRLVFADPTSEARQEMGWQDKFNAPYILRFWDAKQRDEVLRWIDSADVVIQGRFPIKYLRQRIRNGGLTFAYQERFWKRSFNWLKVIARIPRIYDRYWSVMRPNYHLLAAGAYVAPDLSPLGCFKERAWKFGYFLAPSSPPTKTSSTKLQILWCARFSKVKRAGDAIRIARALKLSGLEFELTMVGDGELRTQVEEEAVDLQEMIRFTGWQTAQEVEAHMLNAHILLMTSGFGEGWAMVINEAQSRGCMVVANKEVGAAPWLIDDGVSGLLYAQDELDQLTRRLANLNLQKIELMGERAQRSIQTWSADVAAQRLCELSRALLRGEHAHAKNLFDEGPCSSAE